MWEGRRASGWNGQRVDGYRKRVHVQHGDMGIVHGSGAKVDVWKVRVGKLGWYGGRVGG